MADVPEGTRLIGGPGLWFPVIVLENVYVFPGVPEIFQRKFRRIRELFRDKPYHIREIYLRADEGQIAAILHAVLARFPALLLGSYPYFDERAYSIKLTLESKDPAYVAAAHDMLIGELARIDLTPLAGE
jgi:molybdopterin-biosynthesis enzyme MoeA-like protein